MTQLDAARGCQTLRDLARPQRHDRLPWPCAALAIMALALLSWGAVLLLGRALLN